MRAVAPSASVGMSSHSGGAGGGATGGAAGSTDGAVTAKLGSPPRNRTSTDPGARSLVISSAALDRASSRINWNAEASGAVSRSASATASGPPASAATANSCRTLSTSTVKSMAPL